MPTRADEQPRINLQRGALSDRGKFSVITYGEILILWDVDIDLETFCA